MSTKTVSHKTSWTVVVADEGRCRNALNVIDADEEIIASVINEHTNTTKKDWKHARLIAASPDLLEACEALLNIVDTMNGDFVIGKDYNEAIDKAEAAISKAKAKE